MSSAETQAPYAQALSAALASIVPQAATDWLSRVLEEIEGGKLDRAEWLLRFTQAGRKLGSTSPAQHVSLECAAGRIPLARWRSRDLGRALMLLEAVQADPAREAELVHDLFEQADDDETIALVRSFALLPQPRLHVPLAQECGRVNNVALFSALALDNPYPASACAESGFNQLVLKTMFLGLPLERILGLAERSNAELTRMCEDFIDERLAAGRPVPLDIWLAMAPAASQRARELMRRYAVEAGTQGRYYACAALARLDDPATRQFLQQRIEQESDPTLGARLSALG